MELYLPYNKFMESYSIKETEKIKTSFCKIDHAIKDGRKVVLKKGPCKFIMKEIAFLLACKTDNIVKLLNFTFEVKENNIYGIIALPQGEPLEIGISFSNIEKIIKDITSTLRDLKTLGFVHGDIRPKNILYFPDQDKYCLIDFSRSNKCFHYDHDLMATGNMYEKGYRDYQFYLSDKVKANSISCDYFAFGQTIKALSIRKWNNKEPNFEDEDFIERVQEIHSSIRKEKIVRLCNKVKSLIDHPKNRFSFREDKKEESIVSLPYIEDTKRELWYEIAECAINSSKSMSVRSLFFALTTLRKSLNNLTYENAESMIYTHFFLASSLFEEEGPWTIGTFLKDNQDKTTTTFCDNLVQIINSLNGVFYLETLWDKSYDVKDLIENLVLLIKGEDSFDITRSGSNIVMTTKVFVPIFRKIMGTKTLPIYLDEFTKIDKEIIEENPLFSSTKSLVKKEGSNSLMLWNPEEDIGAGLIYELYPTLLKRTDLAITAVSLIAEKSDKEDYSFIIGKERLSALNNLGYARIMELEINPLTAPLKDLRIKERRRRLTPSPSIWLGYSRGFSS